MWLNQMVNKKEHYLKIRVTLSTTEMVPANPPFELCKVYEAIILAEREINAVLYCVIKASAREE